MDQPNSENLPNQKTVSSELSEGQSQSTETLSEAPATQVVETGDGQKKQQQAAVLTAPSTGEVSDDDVQYLISVPRRKKRKRRRVLSFQPTICGTQNPVPPVFQHLMPFPQNPHPVRRDSAGISSPMEAVHIRDEHNSQSSGPRAYSPTTQFQKSPQSTNTCPSSEPKQYPAFSTSMPAPEIPTQPSQSFSFPQQNWSFASLNTPSTKRKRSEGFQDEEPPFQFPYPPLLPGPPDGIQTSQNNIGSVSVRIPSPVHTDPSGKSLFGPVFNDPREFNWNTLTWEYPPLYQTDIPTPIPRPVQENSGSLEKAPEKAPERKPSKTSQHLSQQRPDVLGPVFMTPETARPPPPIQTPVSDLRRNPSLYKIPPWVPPSTAPSMTSDTSCHRLDIPQQNPQDNQSSPQMSPRLMPVQAFPQPQIPHTNSAQPSPSANKQVRRPSFIRPPGSYISPYAPVPPQQRSRSIIPQHGLSILVQQQQENDSNAAQTQTEDQRRSSPQTPVSRESNATSKASNRAPSPNLIVDIAETCQENFPFAMIAQRHNVKIQKVFDTFSAIIQIPLLRNATDNRRNGPLGTARMKEFRDAKRAAKEA